jgi:hypothetical protein
MPRYFFYLSFGRRVVRDDEGVELPNRSAARDEALAVARELVNPEIGGNSRRWAGWFLQVADEQGKFFRTPMGHPALEIVGADFRPVTNEASQHPQAPDTDAQWRRATMDAKKISENRQRTAELLQRSRRLEEALSSLCDVAQSLIVRARLTAEHSRAIRRG